VKRGGRTTATATNPSSFAFTVDIVYSNVSRLTSSNRTTTLYTVARRAPLLWCFPLFLTPLFACRQFQMKIPSGLTSARSARTTDTSCPHSRASSGRKTSGATNCRYSQSQETSPDSVVFSARTRKMYITLVPSYRILLVDAGENSTTFNFRHEVALGSRE